MKTRCTNERAPAFPDYGGRGISVCPQWSDSFVAFVADMGECPDGLTIERLDNNRGYEPGNCVWATRQVQNRNKRTTRMLTADGLTLSVAEWAERSGVKLKTICQRLRIGWSEQDAATLPTRVR